MLVGIITNFCLLPVPAEQREVPPVKEEEKEDEKTKRRKNKKKSGEEQIARYRELLKGIQQKESLQRGDNEMEMEVSWVPGR